MGICKQVFGPRPIISDCRAEVNRTQSVFCDEGLHLQGKIEKKWSKFGEARIAAACLAAKDSTTACLRRSGVRCRRRIAVFSWKELRGGCVCGK
jgi:predicted HTH transcriptional regulator